ncbi:MAG: hypothetical protein ACXWEF_05370 [Solirubrobacterales bacterium]
MIELLLGLLIFGAAVYFVSAPLRRNPNVGDEGEGPDSELADLEARKEAKYREIRDAELDRAAGKLSEEDFRRQDAELRREAVEILEQIDSRPGRRPG